MTNGTVRNWNSSQGWNFIIGDDGENHFLLKSNVCTGQNIANDCSVEFDTT